MDASTDIQRPVADDTSSSAQCYNNVIPCNTIDIVHEFPMRIAIRKLGNSQGVILPKPLLAQAGLEDEADVRVENGAIMLRPVKRAPRDGWADASRAIAKSGDDKLVWPEFGNEGDKAMKW